MALMMSRRGWLMKEKHVTDNRSHPPVITSLRERAEQWLAKPWDNESYSAQLVRDLLAHLDALTAEKELERRGHFAAVANWTRTIEEANKCAEAAESALASTLEELKVATAHQHAVVTEYRDRWQAAEASLRAVTASTETLQFTINDQARRLIAVTAERDRLREQRDLNITMGLEVGRILGPEYDGADFRKVACDLKAVDAYRRALEEQLDAWKKENGRIALLYAGLEHQKREAEARLIALDAALRSLVEKWARRADHGFDPEEDEETRSYWQGVKLCADDLTAALRSQEPSK